MSGNLGERLMEQDDKGLFEEWEFLPSRAGPEKALWKKNEREYLEIVLNYGFEEDEAAIRLYKDGSEEETVGPVKLDSVMEHLENTLD